MSDQSRADPCRACGHRRDAHQDGTGRCGALHLVPTVCPCIVFVGPEPDGLLLGKPRSWWFGP